MPHPTVDIIVPVWNNPTEVRQCLTAALSHSPGARLIIIDNGSSRQTQLVLEEFSEPLGDNALLISSERNLGLVRAINMGLARSDGDYAVILRPHVLVTAGWLDGLVEAARTGIASPLIGVNGKGRSPRPNNGGDVLETCDISFSALALKGELRTRIGGFDEQMDGAEWCLKDFVSRAWSKGYRTCLTARSKVVCTNEPLLGSPTRRDELALSSRARYQERWGIKNHYLIYFGRETDPGSLVDGIDTILNGCRQGHRFTLLLQRHQMVLFRRMGWNGLHTGIEPRILSRLMTERDLRRSVAALRTTFPDLVLVPGSEGAVFPGSDTAVSFRELAETVSRNSACPGGAYTLRGNAMIEEVRDQLRAHQALFGIIESELSPSVAAMAALLVEAFKSGNKLLVMGNGGSAADSQHFVAEMVGRFKLERAALPAVALSTDTSILTAIGNDYGFESVFSRQVEALAAPGDVLVGISTSGNSPNVLKALELGRARGCRTIGLLGKDGGGIKPVCDLALVVPSTDTPRVQEGHIAIIHIVCDLVEKALFT